MKTYLDCIPCFMQQALRAGRVSTNNKSKIKELLDEIGMMVKDIPFDQTPPQTGERIYKKISEITGNYDPYRTIKQHNIKHALRLYPKLKERVRDSQDSLLTAIRLAVAGNVIDLGVDNDFDLERDIEIILAQDFSIFDYEIFRNKLEKASEVLYIGDNAGEGVFDKILIEELPKPVTYVVRDVPVINDVTIKEAEQIKIDEVAEIISSGTTAPGTILKLCNQEFIRRFEDADMIISKGQGNYEGLSEVKRSVFFLLKAKCEIIARNLKVKKNAIILKGINS